MGQSRPLFAHFLFFSQCKDKFKHKILSSNDKSLDGMLGIQTRAAGWKGQTNPLSYGGTPKERFYYLSQLNISNITYQAMRPDCAKFHLFDEIFKVMWSNFLKGFLIFGKTFRAIFFVIGQIFIF